MFNSLLAEHHLAIEPVSMLRLAFISKQAQWCSQSCKHDCRLLLLFGYKSPEDNLIYVGAFVNMLNYLDNVQHTCMYKYTHLVKGY